MRINSKKSIDITLKCRPIIWSITATGGKYLHEDFLGEVEDRFNLWSLN